MTNRLSALDSPNTLGYARYASFAAVCVLLIAAVLLCLPVFHALANLSDHSDAFDQGVSLSSLAAKPVAQGFAAASFALSALGGAVAALVRRAGVASESTKPKSAATDLTCVFHMARSDAGNADTDAVGIVRHVHFSLTSGPLVRA